MKNRSWIISSPLLLEWSISIHQLTIHKTCTWMKAIILRVWWTYRSKRLQIYINKTVHISAKYGWNNVGTFKEDPTRALSMRSSNSRLWRFHKMILTRKIMVIPRAKMSPISLWRPLDSLLTSILSLMMRDWSTIATMKTVEIKSARQWKFNNRLC